MHVFVVHNSIGRYNRIAMLDTGKPIKILAGRKHIKMGNNQYAQTYQDPIHVTQYYMTDAIFEIALDELSSDEELGQFFQLLTIWALDNIIDEQLARRCSPKVIEAVNTAIGVMFSGINKYRWDVHNGQKGGRPKRQIPRINL